jgi:hypothetical protein
MRTRNEWSGSDALPHEQIQAAAVADPDAQPLTEEGLASMRRVSRTRGARLVEHLRGRGDVALSTDEIMALTRD